MKDIVVSICCQTYNQKGYIEKTLSSILEQKTNFEFEVLVYDDASTDGTTLIVEEYAKKNEKIIPFLQKENKFSKGERIWFKYLFPKCKGKYISICDGDDYWTDIEKLQRQVDFLDKNLNFSIVGTSMTIYDENENRFLDWVHPKYVNSEFDITDLAQGNFIFASSVLLRNDFIIENWWHNLPFGDWPLYLLQVNDRKIKIFNESTGVYRKHNNGIFSGLSEFEQNKKIKDCIFQILIHSNLNNKIKYDLFSLVSNREKKLDDENLELKHSIESYQKEISNLKFLKENLEIENSKFLAKKSNILKKIKQLFS